MLWLLVNCTTIYGLPNNWVGMSKRLNYPDISSTIPAWGWLICWMYMDLWISGKPEPSTQSKPLCPRSDPEQQRLPPGPHLPRKESLSPRRGWVSIRQQGGSSGPSPLTEGPRLNLGPAPSLPGWPGVNYDAIPQPCSLSNNFGSQGPCARPLTPNTF